MFGGSVMLDITIIGNQDCPEYEAAQQLATIFQDGASEYEKGKIVIAVGMNCFGQKVKDIDLVVLGQFEQGFKRNINSKAINGKNDEEFKLRNVYFNNFCFCIEVKDHPPQSVLFQADQAYVRYKDREFHNATNQSEGQKYALMGFIKEKVNIKITPRICNFIWFRNLLEQKRITSSHNYLWSRFSLVYLLQSACNQNYPSLFKGYYSFSAFNRNDSLMKDFNQVFSFFSSIKIDIGQLTRNRLERITRKLLKDQQYAKAIGNKLVVIRGRAGTGKTIKLLHVAYELCQRDHRCLILTYNKALVSDIKRLIALAGIKDDIATATIEVKTIHSFMYDILVGFGILNKSLKEAVEKYKLQLRTESHLEEEILREVARFKEQYFLKEYESLKDELIEYFRHKVIDETDIRELMKNEREKIDWEHIFIDESQDWPDNEKEILFYIFGSHQFVIADGIDQLVRKISRSKWTSNVESHIESKGQRKSLRQKTNLCTFIKAYSDQFGLGWDVEPSDDLPGGRIIITTRPYDQEFHNELFQSCEKDGNKPYEMMFLVPPKLVDKQEKEYYRNKIKLKKIVNKFSLTETWNSWGIKIWDGTASDLRSVYPSDVREHRVLQYDSSRGLEGWTVVCLEMDEFFDYKLRMFEDDDEEQQSLALFGDDEKAAKWAHQWMLIPATRAIDTLVIQLGRSDSVFTTYLREITKSFDFVEWID